jgi:hypothetical protein
MSWGEQSPQQPYDPNNPYGQQQPQSQQPFQQPQQPPLQAPGPQPQGDWASPQPFGTGPGYTQPMDGQYPQQGYGQPEFAQYPAGPPPKKGNGMFVGIVVAALVVVGGGITAAVVLTGKHSSPSPSPTSSSSSTVVAAGTQLTAPSSVQGLTKLSGSVADSAVSRMKSSLTAEAEEYPDPTLGAYNDAGGDDVTTILVDEPMDKLSSADQTQLTSSGDAGSIVNEIMTGAGVSNAQTETTAASNGALSCGTKDESGTSVTICVWYDVKTFGTLQYVDGTTPDDAAPVADAIRSAAEG